MPNGVAEMRSPGIWQQVMLCGLIVSVVGGAGFVIYWQGRTTLVASIESKLAEESQHANSSVERSIATLVEKLQSWAGQPVMARILDDDQDREIAELLDVLVGQTVGLSGLTCWDASGAVIASTAQSPRGMEAATERDRFQQGTRYIIEPAGDRVRVVAPIFAEFDEREFIGALEVHVAATNLLPGFSHWWVGLTSASGDVIAQRGPAFPRHIPTDAPYDLPREAEPVLLHSGPVTLPPGGAGPEWKTVIARPVRALLGPVQLLRSTVGLATATSAFVVILLVISSSLRQRRLLQELTSTNVDLGRAKTAAVAAAQAKSEFLANMSHEIRTPMTAILGFTESMLDPDLSHSERLNAIRTVRRNGEHLLQIINDILDISKIDADKLDIERIRCSPVQLLADVQSLMQVRADSKNLSFEIELIGPLPETIQSDPTRLKQILVNLIGNAIKFTGFGGVRLLTRLVDDGAEPELQFDVLDTGLGMTEKQMSKLFQAFSQADASTTRKFGGTGLGLSISKRLAQMLGGDITVQSRSGKGSLFRTTVNTGPLDGVKMLDHPAAAVTTQPEMATVAEPDVGRLAGRILLAEDGPDNQRLISFVLNKAGAEVTVVENGKLAVDAALAAWNRRRETDPEHPFDVILMDMQMPVMDGYEATGLLRQKGYTGPIIALTAHAMEGDRQKCIDAGCDDYASKPINRKKLIETIRAHLQSTVAGVSA